MVSNVVQSAKSAVRDDSVTVLHREGKRRGPVLRETRPGLLRCVEDAESGPDSTDLSFDASIYFFSTLFPHSSLHDDRLRSK